MEGHCGQGSAIVTIVESTKNHKPDFSAWYLVLHVRSSRLRPLSFQGHWSNFTGSIEPVSLYEFCGYEMIDR